jgi:hypothetical protein
MQNQMGRDFAEEIRTIRQYIRDIDETIAYFERLETQLAVKDKDRGRAPVQNPQGLCRSRSR